MYKKAYLLTLFTLFFFSSLLAQGGTVVLFGKQTKHMQRFSTKLESEPVKLEGAGTIIKVTGARKGFWVNRRQGYRNETVYRFWDSQQAVGKKLNPGTYTVYPNLPEGEDEETVSVYLSTGASASAGPTTTTQPKRRPTAQTRRGSGPSRLGEDFLRKYCRIYIEDYQDNFVQAYGMDIKGTPEEKAQWGVYENVDLCVKTITKTQDDTYNACLKSSAPKSKCEEIAAGYKKMMQEGMTKSGCIKIGRGFRCSFYNIGDMSDEELRRFLTGDGQTTMTQEQMEEAKRALRKQFDKCTAEVDAACKDLPASVNW